MSKYYSKLSWSHKSLLCLSFLGSEEEEEEIDPSIIAKENARAIFKMLDINRDGQLDEDEFVDGCLADDMFLEMLLTFNCDFLWGDGIC